jgi:glycosyltransferase
MRDLVQMGEEVHVAMPVDGILVQQYKDAGIHIHELNYSVKNAWGTIKQICKVVNEVKPDIVHSHFVVTTLLMRLALRNYRTARVFEVPGPLHLEHTIYRKADLWTAQKKKDFWIPTCRWSMDKYKECGIDDSRLFLTYYGGDLVDREYQKGLLREELSLTDKDIIVGMVAYMYAPKKFLGEKRGLKGHEDLIDAVAMIQDKYPNIHLVFIGGPWVGAEKYEQEVIVYGKEKVRNVHFLGTRRNVPDLYQDFDMVVHPSHSENLGGASESLMLAVPTIASNVGGFPDIVIPGKTGFLSEPFNPQSIADAIEKVIANPAEAKQMAEYGKTYLHDLLNAKKTSRDVYDFYRLIIERFDKNNPQ